jgi:hypothetical protein
LHWQRVPVKHNGRRVVSAEIGSVDVELLFSDIHCDAGDKGMIR